MVLRRITVYKFNLLRNKIVLRLGDDYTIMAMKNSNLPVSINRQNFQELENEQ